MEDIVPGLLDAINAEFDVRTSKSIKLKKAFQLLQEGNVSYLDAHDFAVEISQILTDVFRENLGPDILPDGKMYYNIAERILNDTLSKNHELISGFSADVQTQLNQLAELRLKAQIPELNQDRIDGLINRISSEDFENVSWLLGDPIVNFGQSIVDDSIQKNLDFQYKAGLRPRIIRKAESKACKWCQNLAGIYLYPDDVPDDIFRRHQRCRCSTDFNPGDGKRQDVWSKRWEAPRKNAKMEARKDIVEVNKTTLYGAPNSITQINGKRGGVTRNHYDETGRWAKQISNDHHGFPKKHPFGKNGEHAHDIVWENGKLVDRIVRELTDAERKEHGDIL